ncbi:MAG: T9SS type A sorting domain-containing protein [Ignavibacteriae bacterium]|jgi:hypothetical protein|nr:T9SS C-terminal target domain-containing protein [Ignavibacteriota bacterium]NOG98535.1 T9SS type A sorting domain-containing protein [Ignavibacteriota bacterium]
MGGSKQIIISIKIIKAIAIAFLLLSISLLSAQSNNQIYLFNNNNLFIDLDNKGNISENEGKIGGQNGIEILFCSGFFLSGYDDENHDGRLTITELWANAMMLSSRIEDYKSGVYEKNNSKAEKFYKIREIEEPFSDSWIRWIDAVNFGAGFYDGNKDGIYNPVDLNSDNKWDYNEDRPDNFLGTQAWCVYHDGVNKDLRRFSVYPKGIEIRQTVFAKSFTNQLNNILFVRYALLNTGIAADTLHDLYFSVFSDPDIIDDNKNLIGCDTVYNLGYSYYPEGDTLPNEKYAAFGTVLLKGPTVKIPGVTYFDNNSDKIFDPDIDTPLDSAINYKGYLGIDTVAGAVNLEMTSFNHGPSTINPWHDPTIAEHRKWQYGETMHGPIHISTWEFGNGAELGEDTVGINTKFMYSGNPVTGKGWLNTEPIDQRFLQTTGTFNLVKDEPQEIFVAYIASADTSFDQTIIQLKQTAELAHKAYQRNFGIEPPPQSNISAPTVIKSYKLFQNYPNPFNPTTKIKFSIPGSEEMFGNTSQVKLKVYDILGNEITTLVNEKKAPGNYEVEFDPVGLASGVYIYRLVTPEFSRSMKMLLMK